MTLTAKSRSCRLATLPCLGLFAPEMRGTRCTGAPQVRRSWVRRLSMVPAGVTQMMRSTWIIGLQPSPHLYAATVILGCTYMYGDTTYGCSPGT